jgi:hypothetical protein
LRFQFGQWRRQGGGSDVGKQECGPLQPGTPPRRMPDARRGLRPSGCGWSPRWLRAAGRQRTPPRAPAAAQGWAAGRLVRLQRIWS